jgi:hypothetical protein
MDLIRYDLGDALGAFPASNTTSALMAYGTSGGYVSIAYWNGTLTDCPSSCPALASNYYYIFGTAAVAAAAITLQDLQVSLAGSNAAVTTNFSTTSMLLNGAHSRPMSRRVAKGERTFWVAGDWGKDDHGAKSGATGLAEVGVGYNYGPVQINASLGRTWNDQQLAEHGSVRATGQYLMVEGIVPLSEAHGVYATLGAYGHWGEADIVRGYYNMGAQDASHASPNTETWGLRARVDWENAVQIKRTALSPYADLSFSRSMVDRYTERDGGLPARFDGRTEEVTELRLGLNSATALGASGYALVTSLEAAHRFDERGARSTGEVIGLFSFDLDGQDYDTDWIKAGIGVEGALAGGKLSVMLNGTTEGSALSAWLAASWQQRF